MDAELPLANELAALTVRIADLLLTRETVDEAVHALAAALVEAIPGSIGAGVSLLDARGRQMSAGATDSAVLEADRLQYELGQGPCLAAWATKKTVTVEDTRTDPRWPAWTEAVARMPLRSVISTPLVTPHETIGALKVYSGLPGGIGLEAVRVLELLARPAALMLANTQTRETAQRLSDGLVRTLADRDAVRTAAGILMERHAYGQDEALQALIAESREQRISLNQLARNILDGPAGS